MNAAMPLAAGGLDAAILSFCRVSAFIMVLPGFSSIRIPVRIRLFVAFGLSLILAPLIGPQAKVLPETVVAEVFTGASLGLLVRLMFLAFGFAANAIAAFAGIAAMPGAPLDTDEPMSPLAALIALTATALVFASGLHAVLITGLAASFELLPVGLFVDPARLLAHGVEVIADSFLLALRLMMPFLVFSVLVNMSIGLANKMSPQIPVYFISMPFVAAGGLAAAWALLPDIVAHFSSAIRDMAAFGWL
jgi:flagellar biosynthetic protein FliR